MRRLSLLVGSVCAFFIAAVVVLYYLQPELLEQFEARTYDLRSRMVRGTVPPTGEIVIVAIDEESLAELGRFPWPRTNFARFLDTVSAAGARAVLFDVIFPEPETAAADGQFAEAVRRAGNVTLPIAFFFDRSGAAAQTTRCLPVLRAAARREAHINLFPDEDGVIRWNRLLVPLAGEDHASLGLAAAAEALRAGQFAAEPYRVRLGERLVLTDVDHRYLIPYLGPAGTIPRLSFAAVAAGRVPAAALRDKVLMVGPTALGIYDMRITPYSNNTPGVEAHAQLAEAIFQGAQIHRGGWEALFDLVAIILVGAGVAVAATTLRAGAALPLALVILAAHLGATIVLFRRGHWISVVYPVVVGTLCYGAASYLRFILLDRRERRIRSMFSCYVSRKLVDTLVHNPELAKIGGDARVVTIMFVDVKNYTGYSERRTPAEVVRVLNDYLAEMTHVITEHEGTIDKFLGDGILAYWGAPLPQENHPALAVRCAFAMMGRLADLNQKWVLQGLEPLKIGIGVNTGEVIAGNIGAEGEKMEYTVIGDNVNLTYRIQDESRAVDCPVITEATWHLVREVAEADLIGPVMVKGKQKPVVIYALRGVKECCPRS